MKNLLNFKQLIKSENIGKIIVVCGILGIALIFLSSFSGQSKPDDSASYSDMADYQAQMQGLAKEMLESIEGVGEANVLLTIENSPESVYLQNNSTKTKEIEPVVRGVVVACSGGDEPVTVQRVTEAVTKAFNISTAKVYVTKLQE